MDGLDVRDGLPGRLKAMKAPRLRRAAVALALTLVVALLLAWTVPLPSRLGEPPSTVVRFRDGSPAYAFLSPDDKYRIAADLKAVDPAYLSALLRFEDKRYYVHPGVDPIAVLRSIRVNLAAGQVVTGASTITMQLVRILEPRPRTLLSKSVEALRAVQLELRLPKDEILAAYLTFLPFGKNVEGLEAASFAYFGHSARDLAPEEIATLLAVPQSPTRRYPSEENAAALREARDEIAAWLAERGVFGGEVLAQVRAVSVPRELRPLPRDAPHAAWWLRSLRPGPEIGTTLDRGVQHLVDRRLAAARAELEPLGIHNGAVVVVDHETAEVLALAGSFDFWDEEHGGQIAGFAAARSPGSALKPFIYALALDRGLVLPEHLLVDVPTSYGPYAPSNYDGEFAGLVRAEDALSESLNVPFVRLLGQVGVERFAATLRRLGATSLRDDPGFYGLSAAIGAMEVTPLELAGFYTALAEDGGFRELRVLPGKTPPAVEVLSPGATYLTRRALLRRDRPDFPARRRFSGAPARVHWKTGTSYGHRDAWAAGSGPRHTAVVWLGNFDMAPSVDLVGADAAGPILFDLLEALADRSGPPAVTTRPHDLKRIMVCAYSGFLPTAACPERREAWALRQRVPTRKCPYHLQADVDLETGLRLNPSCRGGRRYETRSFVVWPADVRRYLVAHHRVLTPPPSLLPGCEASEGGLAPRIVSPPPDQILVLLPGLAASDQEVPLRAEADVPGRLSWFVDGEFLGTVEGDEELWWTPRPGHHQFLVMDEAGRASRRLLKVRRSS